MAAVLRAKLGAEVVEVKDVSGGCGSFYTVLVVAPQFEGMPTMKQHRCVCPSELGDVTWLSDTHTHTHIRSTRAAATARLLIVLTPSLYTPPRLCPLPAAL
jgi:acid stress-induced BolA-like protein IbaG/YrbA